MGTPSCIPKEIQVKYIGSLVHAYPVEYIGSLLMYTKKEMPLTTVREPTCTPFSIHQGTYQGFIQWVR